VRFAAGWALAFSACGGAFCFRPSDDCTTVLRVPPIPILPSSSQREGSGHSPTLFRPTCIVSLCRSGGPVSRHPTGDCLHRLSQQARRERRAGFHRGLESGAGQSIRLWPCGGKMGLAQDAEIENPCRRPRAFGQGTGILDERGTGVIHDGELSGKNKPEGDILAIPSRKHSMLSNPRTIPNTSARPRCDWMETYSSCRTTVCGGLNVSFSGIYRGRE